MEGEYLNSAGLQTRSAEGFQTNANEKEWNANGRESDFSTLFVFIRGPFGLDSR